MTPYSLCEVASIKKHVMYCTFMTTYSLCEFASIKKYVMYRGRPVACHVHQQNNLVKWCALTGPCPPPTKESYALLYVKFVDQTSRVNLMSASERVTSQGKAFWYYNDCLCSKWLSFLFCNEILHCWAFRLLYHPIMCVRRVFGWWWWLSQFS
jgi:hypothetical protein